MEKIMEKNDNEKEINIAVIGAGGNTCSKHIPLFQQIKGVNIVGVINRTEASSKKVADQFKIPKIYKTIDNVFKDKDVDAVMIGTWPNKHKEYSLRAIKAGKHVLTEARMAMDLKEAKEMLTEGKKKPGLIKQIVPAPFTLALDSEIQQIVKTKLGKIKHITLSVLGGSFPGNNAKYGWRDNPSLSGENILSMGIFYETMMRWVGEATSLQALGHKSLFQKMDARSKKNKNTSYPDNLMIVGKLKDHKAVFNLHFCAFAYGNPEKIFYIAGDKATLKIDIEKGSLFLLRSGETKWKNHSFEKGTGWRVEEEFINAIRGKEKITHTTFQDGVKYMAFTTAVWGSLKTGKTHKIIY